jgi:hypothetical protein
MESFEQVVKSILAKYKDKPLVSRWQEAIAFGKGEKAESYWIRDSEDVVNIVWLNPDGIRDITWHPPSNESMFNFVPLKSIITFEVREKENIGPQLLHVTGNFLVHVVVGTRPGDLWWVAQNEESKQQLHAFLTSVMNRYTKAVR